MRIAIDGPSGSGKSSVAKAVAKRLGLLHLDTGGMYRTLGYKVIKDGLNLENIEEVLKNLDLKIVNKKFFLDGEDVSEKIRSNEVSKIASKVSSIKSVREYMVNLQREISSNNDVILDGRDIGTVVFPNAEVKIYLTASPEVRANRRYLEDGSLSYEKILEDILKRDYDDSHREHSPLKVADGAKIIDTDNLSFEEAAAFISDDKDTRNNHGLMAFKDRENQTLTSKFQMKDLPTEIDRVGETMKVGEISQAFEMKNDKGKTVCAIIKLKSHQRVVGLISSYFGRRWYYEKV